MEWGRSDLSTRTGWEIRQPAAQSDANALIALLCPSANASKQDRIQVGCVGVGGMRSFLPPAHGGQGMACSTRRLLMHAWPSLRAVELQTTENTNAVEEHVAPKCMSLRTVECVFVTTL